jgi:deoxyribonucleoside regulator
VNGSSTHLSRLVQVARAYYLENQTQAEIARGLGISRSLVSRYLTAAREQGIVRIEIVEPSTSALHLEQALKDHFPHLKEVVVAPALTTDSDAIRVMIGRYAANFLLSILKPGQIIGLGCGRTLRAMVDGLQKRHLAESIVVQAMGNIGHEAHNIDYNEIARQAAAALGGRTYYVSAPAILGKRSGSAHDLVNANPSLQYALSLAKRAQIYIIGLGSMESDQLYVRNGLIPQDEFDDLRQRAVGDICGRFFDVHGQEQSSAFAERIIGIELEDLRRADAAIGVAGGAEKIPAILGALRGQFINVLVSDEATAQTLLEWL